MDEARILYRVKGWEQHFESAKSKTFGLKAQTYMPNKHGLGYKRLLALPSGEAMFGAWCSLCQILSRHTKPRQGYLTDTGRPDGIPWTSCDISLLSGFGEDTVRQMLINCAAPEIAWLETLTKAKDTTRIPQGYHKDTTRIPQGYHKDTTRIPQGYYGSLPGYSPSPSPSPLPLPSPAPETALVRLTADAPAAMVPFASLVGQWNTICGAAGLARVKTITDSRKAKLRTRWASPEFRAGFGECLSKLATSSFARGESKSGWRATFDWLIDNDRNWAKVIEGQYDGPPQPATTAEMLANYDRRQAAEAAGAQT